jgi:O-antigen/teichoic acid export membrane protein
MIRHQVHFAISSTEVRKTLSFGLPQVPGAILNTLRGSADRLLISALMGPAFLGLYALATRLGQLVQILVVGPFRLVGPAAIFSAENESDAPAFYARLQTYFLLVATFVALGVALLAEDVLEILAAREFWSSATLVPWICFGVVIRGSWLLLSVGYLLNRRTVWFSITIAFDLVIYLGLVYLLVPMLGLIGPGIALCLSTASTAVLCYGTSRRFYPLQVEGARLLKAAFAALIVLGIGRLVSDLELQHAVSIFVNALVVMGFPLLLFPLRFWEGGELDKARQLYRDGRRKWNRRLRQPGVG